MISFEIAGSPKSSSKLVRAPGASKTVKILRSSESITETFVAQIVLQRKPLRLISVALCVLCGKSFFLLKIKPGSSTQRARRNAGRKPETKLDQYFSPGEIIQLWDGVRACVCVGARGYIRK